MPSHACAPAPAAARGAPFGTTWPAQFAACPGNGRAGPSPCVWEPARANRGRFERRRFPAAGGLARRQRGTPAAPAAASARPPSASPRAQRARARRAVQTIANDRASARAGRAPRGGRRPSVHTAGTDESRLNEPAPSAARRTPSARTRGPPTDAPPGAPHPAPALDAPPNALRRACRPPRAPGPQSCQAPRAPRRAPPGPVSRVHRFHVQPAAACSPPAEAPRFCIAPAAARPRPRRRSVSLCAGCRAARPSAAARPARPPSLIHGAWIRKIGRRV